MITMLYAIFTDGPIRWTNAPLRYWAAVVLSGVELLAEVLALGWLLTAG